MVFPGYMAGLGQAMQLAPHPNQIPQHSLGTLFMVKSDKLLRKFILQTAKNNKGNLLSALTCSL